VLAAGASSRFGDVKQRILLEPVLERVRASSVDDVLVVLGAALVMQKAGMSMALGAFLAGVLLAESNYRHELEADIEPFRGLLLALFFMGIGMSFDLAIVPVRLHKHPITAADGRVRCWPLWVILRRRSSQ